MWFLPRVTLVPFCRQALLILSERQKPQQRQLAHWSGTRVVVVLTMLAPDLLPHSLGNTTGLTPNTTGLFRIFQAVTHMAISVFYTRTHTYTHMRIDTHTHTHTHHKHARVNTHTHTHTHIHTHGNGRGNNSSTGK